MQTGYIRLLSLEHLAWFALETRGGWKTGGENRSPGGKALGKVQVKRLHLSNAIR